MAIYPVKLLKDESGSPFVPLTSMSAVIGEELVQTTLTATEVSTGHFVIESDKLTEIELQSKIIAVVFPDEVTATTNSYLKLNSNGTEYQIFEANGTSPLLVKDYVGAICFIMLKGNKWQLIRTSASGSGGGGGHTILDGDGNVMPQQSILQFKGFGVSDSAGTGATVISTPSLINNLSTSVSGTGPLDAYQGKVLNDKFANYLTKEGNAVSASRLSATTMPGSTDSASGFLHLLSWEITTGWSGMSNIYALTDTEASQTVGVFGITFRTGSTFDVDGKGLSLAWLSGNLYVMPELTATIERTASATIVRLYVKRDTWRTYRLATMVDTNDRAVAKGVYSFVTSVSGTVVATSNGVKASVATLATKADQLTTARTLTIGNTGKSFNGTANLSWSLSEIGAAAASHSHNVISNRGTVAPDTGTTVPGYSGLSMVSAYNNGYPYTFGNVLRLYGGGFNELLMCWNGGGGHASVYQRSKRDVESTAWSEWYTMLDSANYSNWANKAFVQSSQPTAKATGDIWFVV